MNRACSTVYKASEGIIQLLTFQQHSFQWTSTLKRCHVRSAISSLTCQRWAAKLRWYFEGLFYIYLISEFTLSTTGRSNKYLSFEILPTFFFRLSIGICRTHLFQRHLLAAKQSMEIWIHSWTQISHAATHHSPNCPTSSGAFCRKTRALSLNWHTSL